jgi:hypothetical protein
MAGKYEGYGRPDGGICYTSADPFATFLMTAKPAATPRPCPPEPFTSHAWSKVIHVVTEVSDIKSMHLRWLVSAVRLGGIVVNTLVVQCRIRVQREQGGIHQDDLIRLGHLTCSMKPAAVFG